jgi:DNA-binding transcriptional regulator YhcF (GntR family)
MKITLQYAYEDIKDWGYVQDQRQKNHFIGTIVNIDF